MKSQVVVIGSNYGDRKMFPLAVSRVNATVVHGLGHNKVVESIHLFVELT